MRLSSQAALYPPSLPKTLEAECRVPQALCVEEGTPARSPTISFSFWTWRGWSLICTLTLSLRLRLSKDSLLY